MKNLFVIICLCSTLPVWGQDSTASTTFSAYIETFVSYDARNPTPNSRPTFLYSHNRNREININLAYLKGAYNADKARASLALAVGTYMTDNYAGEPAGFRNILEASAGFRAGAKTWIDAGVLPSHIGFESAVAKDCWTLTRGIAAENSPYYETGVKITRQPNDRWTLSALMLNGWQRIARVGATPAWGAQAIWKPKDHTTLNWSSYVGKEQTGSDSTRWRIFNDLYGIFQLSDRMGLILGFDIGFQESYEDRWNIWYTPNLVLRAALDERWTVAARAEYYSDRKGLILVPGFAVAGGSLNVDYAISRQALLRFEARYLNGSDAIFYAGARKGRLYGTASLSVGF